MGWGDEGEEDDSGGGAGMFGFAGADSDDFDSSWDALEKNEHPGENDTETAAAAAIGAPSPETGFLPPISSQHLSPRTVADLPPAATAAQTEQILLPKLAHPEHSRGAAVMEPLPLRPGGEHDGAKRPRGGALSVEPGPGLLLQAPPAPPPKPNPLLDAPLLSAAGVTTAPLIPSSLQPVQPPSQPSAMQEAEAATKIQAMQRGKAAQKNLGDQKAAAITVQAAQRGRIARRGVAATRDAAFEKNKPVAEPEPEPEVPPVGASDIRASEDEDAEYGDDSFGSEDYDDDGFESEDSGSPKLEAQTSGTPSHSISPCISNVYYVCFSRMLY